MRPRFSGGARPIALAALCSAVFTAAFAEESAPINPKPALPADKAGSNAPAAAKPKPEDDWTSARLAQLVKDLSDERFSVRERATQDLGGAPASMIPQMVKTGRDHDDPEVQKGLFDASRKIFMAKILKNLAEWKMGRGFLGIGWGISEDPPGILVNQVIANTGAEKAEIKDGDLIVKIDKREIGEGFTSDDAVKIWKAMAPGDPMKLEIRRNGETVTIDATVGEVPEEYRDPDAAQTENEERAEALWGKYLGGDLKVPERLFQPGADATPEPTSKPGPAAEAKSTEPPKP